MNTQKDIIAYSYRGTFLVFMLSMPATAIGNVIDGIIIGNLLGSNSMAAFGFTTPYQKFIEKRRKTPSTLLLRKTAQAMGI